MANTTLASGAYSAVPEAGRSFDDWLKAKMKALSNLSDELKALRDLRSREGQSEQLDHTIDVVENLETRVHAQVKFFLYIKARDLARATEARQELMELRCNAIDMASAADADGVPLVVEINGEVHDGGGGSAFAMLCDTLQKTHKFEEKYFNALKEVASTTPSPAALPKEVSRAAAAALWPQIARKTAERDGVVAELALQKDLAAPRALELVSEKKLLWREMKALTLAHNVHGEIVRGASSDVVAATLTQTVAAFKKLRKTEEYAGKRLASRGGVVDWWHMTRVLAEVVSAAREHSNVRIP